MILPACILFALTTGSQAPKPEAVCLDLKGRQVQPLKQTTPPKATVLVFYIAHCPIAQKMIPEINRIEKEFKKKGAQVYMIHEDTTLSAEEVGKEAKTYGLLPTVLIDKWHTQMKACDAKISPEAFVYDSKMKLRYQGRITDLFYGLGQMRAQTFKHDLRDAVAAVVAGKAPVSASTEAIGCILPRS